MQASYTNMECEKILKKRVWEQGDGIPPSPLGTTKRHSCKVHCKQANIENCDKTYIDFIPSSLKQFGIEVAMPEIQKKLLAEVT